MRYKFIVLFMLIFIFSSRGQQAESVSKEDPFNFHFTTDRADVKWEFYNVQAITKDSTQLVNNKYPLSFERSLKSLSRCKACKWNTATMSQRIFFQKETNKNMKISIRAYTKNITQAYFFINRYNEKLELVCQDTLGINMDGWNTYYLTLPSLPSEVIDIGFVVTAIGTGLSEKYKEPGFKQCLDLDKMEITVDGTNIESLAYTSLNKFIQPFSINPKKIVPLNVLSEKEHLHLKDKKILALGETIHFNGEVHKVAFELIKNRILNNQCRLVLLEIDFNMGQLLNYYVSGYTLTPEYINIMKKSTISIFSESWYDFFDWLREYNKNKQRKVLLLGIDRDENSLSRPELEVLNSCISKQAGRDSLANLFDNVAKNEFKQSIELADEKKEILQKNMDSDTYSLFRYCLTLSSQNLDMENLINGKFFNEKDKKLLERDKFMFHTTKYYMDTFLQNEETVCIFTHLGHVAKSPTNSFNNVLPLGYYLRKAYGENYSAIGIVVGGGVGTVKGSIKYIRGCNIITNIKLTEPVENSIEYAAKKLSNHYFYYPLDTVNLSLSFIRETGTYFSCNVEELNKINQFSKFISPFGVMDGFIYIPEGRSLYNTTITDDKIKEIGNADTFTWNRRYYFLKGNFK
jgi:erythromycin esterase-like protein